MPATQRDIRVFEEQQADQDQTGTAVPEPVAPLSTHISRALPSGGTLPLGPKLPEIQTTSPAMDQAVSGLLQGQKDLNKSLGTLQPEVEARRAALGAELERPLPAAPNLQQVPQFQPRVVSQEEMNLFAGVTMALAGLGTKAMRGDISMALNAAGSAMKGFNEGNLQQSRLEMEQFKKSMDGVIAENQRMSEQYRSIIENRKLSLDQKSQALRVAAASRDDQIMLSALQSGQLRTVFDLEAHRINATNQASMRSAQIYNSALDHLRPKEEPLVPELFPDGSVRRMPPRVGQLVPSSTQNRPPPGEIMRMNIAVTAAGKALDNYEKILTSFDPRSWDQMNPTQRAKIQAAISSTQLEWKEAAALGALTGPDLEIMSKTLVNPATLMGAYYDRDGLNAQINEARGYFSRRRESIKEFYPGIDQPGGRPAIPKTPGTATFANEAAARAANLEPGTRVIINGVSGTWQ